MKKQFLNICQLLSLIVTLSLIIGCVQKPTLSTKVQNFNQYPEKIILLQIVGLDFELLSNLEINENSDNKNKLNAFDDFSCIGVSWEYNLAKLRPPSWEVSLNHLSGQTHFKQTCEDYKQPPFWSYLNSATDLPVVIVEHSTENRESILRVKDCGSDLVNDWINGNSTYYFSMKNVSSKKVSLIDNHYLDFAKLKAGKYYKDRSCNLEGDCGTSISQNILALYNAKLKYAKRYVLVYRDFDLEKKLQKGNVLSIQKKIKEINQLIQTIKSSLLTSETLFLVLGESPRILLVPDQGIDLANWSGFKMENTKDGKEKNDRVEKSYQSLYTKVWAMGARSENFCGTYDSAQILQRIFWSNTKKTPIWK